MGEAIATYTEAEYLAIEEVSEVRHEYVGGRLYQMAGGTERHELAVGALARRLHPVPEPPVAAPLPIVNCACRRAITTTRT